MKKTWLFALSCLCLASGCGHEGLAANPPAESRAVEVPGVMSFADVEARLKDTCGAEAQRAAYERCMDENEEIRADPGFGSTVFERTTFVLESEVPELVGTARRDLLRAWDEPAYSEDGIELGQPYAWLDEWPLHGTWPEASMLGAYEPTWTYVGVEYDEDMNVQRVVLHAEYFLL